MNQKMRKWLLTLLLTLCAPLWAANVSDIRVSNGATQARITFQFTGDPQYTFTPVGKRTVALDIHQSGIIQGLPLDFNGQNMVRRIRAGQPQGSGNVRLLVDLTQDGKTQAIKRRTNAGYSVVFTIDAISKPLPPAIKDPRPVVKERVAAAPTATTTQPAKNPFQPQSERTTAVVAGNRSARPAAARHSRRQVR